MAYKVDADKLEEMIDAGGLTKLVDALSVIAFEKAEHIRSNWQDVTTANAWERDAKALQRLAAQLVC